MRRRRYEVRETTGMDLEDTLAGKAAVLKHGV
jgi:hypothetical protein